MPNKQLRKEKKKKNQDRKGLETQSTVTSLKSTSHDNRTVLGTIKGPWVFCRPDQYSKAVKPVSEGTKTIVVVVSHKGEGEDTNSAQILVEKAKGSRGRLCMVVSFACPPRSRAYEYFSQNSSFPL